MENNNQVPKEDKIVFVFERGSQIHDDIFESKYFQAVSKAIDTVLRLNSVNTDRVFFGGDKLDLKCFITGLLQFCNLADNIEASQSIDYENDEDFDAENELPIDVDA